MQRLTIIFFFFSEAEQRMWPECRAWFGNGMRLKTHSKLIHSHC